LKFFVIGDEDMVLGFSLVGVDGVVVSEAQGARQALDTAMAQNDIGIILLSERVANMIRPEVKRYFYYQAYPLIVEIPDRLGTVGERVAIKDVVQAAVGVRIE
jgi:V/A-type H+-transporting ATPase subunit F